MGATFNLSCTPCCNDSTHCRECLEPPPNAWMVRVGGVTEKAGCPDGEGSCADFNRDYIVCRRPLGTPPQYDYCHWCTVTPQGHNSPFIGDCWPDVIDICREEPGNNVSVCMSIGPSWIPYKVAIGASVTENNMPAVHFIEHITFTPGQGWPFDRIDCREGLLMAIGNRVLVGGVFCDFSEATFEIIEIITG